jgi:co-chaperonin GroES (HSP10)
MRPAMKMIHNVDPRKVIWDSAGDLKTIDLAANQVLIGLYKRPEKTASGLYLADQTRKEDEYQGKVGLVLKMGPLAFDDDEYFKGFRANVGDWVAAWVSDGKQIQINDCLCRVVKDSEVRLRVDAPDRVY